MTSYLEVEEIQGDGDLKGKTPERVETAAKIHNSAAWEKEEWEVRNSKSCKT